MKNATLEQIKLLFFNYLCLNFWCFLLLWDASAFHILKPYSQWYSAQLLLPAEAC